MEFWLSHAIINAWSFSKRVWGIGSLNFEYDLNRKLTIRALFHYIYTGKISFRQRRQTSMALRIAKQMLPDQKMILS